MSGIVQELSCPVTKALRSSPLTFNQPHQYFEHMSAINSTNLRNLNRALDGIFSGLPPGRFAITTAGSDGRGENFGSLLDLTVVCEDVIQGTCLRTLIREAISKNQLTGLPLRFSGIVEGRYLRGDELSPAVSPLDLKNNQIPRNLFWGASPRLYNMAVSHFVSDIREMGSVKIVDSSLVCGSAPAIKQAKHLFIEQLISRPDTLNSLIRAYKIQLKDFKKCLLTGQTSFKGREITHFRFIDDRLLESYCDKISAHSVKYSVLRALQYRLHLDLLLAIKQSASGSENKKNRDILINMDVNNPEQLSQSWAHLAESSFPHFLIDNVFDEPKGVVGRLSAISLHGLSSIGQNHINQLQDLYKTGLWIYHAAQHEFGTKGQGIIQVSAPDNMNLREGFNLINDICQNPIIKIPGS